MGYFFQQFINGISAGAIYGLIAIGYTMVYGVVKMINFAHGEIYMIGAFTSLIGFLLLESFGITSPFVSILLILAFSVIITMAYGWTMERVAYRPLRSSGRLAPLISAIGVSIFLQNFIRLAQGPRLKTFSPLVNGNFVLFTDANEFSVTISAMQILIFCGTICLMALFSLVISRTDLGRAQRAVAQDRLMASLLGIDTDRIIAITFMVGAGLAAIAGLMVTLYYGVVDFSIGFMAGLKAFTAAVLGGIGSLQGALLGGLLLGLIESLWAAYLNAEYRDCAAFVILLLILIIRPSGLLGEKQIEKV